MIGLTRKQRIGFTFIQNYILEHNCSPSFQDIADGLGLKSKSGVHRLLQQLVERGAISYQPRRSHSIVLVPANAIAVHLPPQLKAVIESFAARAGVTPEAIVVEVLRDKFTLSSHFGTRETKRSAA